MHIRSSSRWCAICFFFNDTATTEIYTLSLHDALPILLVHFGAVDHSAQVWFDGQLVAEHVGGQTPFTADVTDALASGRHQDRKSTRLNSSHANISYAVFCLKKKQSLYPFFSSHSRLAP